MQKQFVTYKIALALKELGFNEECFGFFDKDSEFNMFEYFDLERQNSTIQSNYGGVKQCTAPLWQQAIDWFRINHDIIIEPDVFDKGFLEDDKFCFQWHIYYKSSSDEDICVSPKEWKTYEEARENAILEGIDLVENI